ncbi:MAG: Uma2 family endonuclease [Planctomycetota bacterium]
MSRPPVTTTAQLLTLDRSTARHELVRGKLRTMPLNGCWHGAVAAHLICCVSRFVRRHRLGQCVGSSGFRLASNPDTVLAADFSFVRAERVPKRLTWDYFAGPPDLAAEVLEPDEPMAVADDRVAMWLEHGTRSVWVVHPRLALVAVHPAEGAGAVFAGNEQLTDPVVPRLRFRVSELFA